MLVRVRWLYHVVPVTQPLVERYAPDSLSREGFVHCSFRDDVAESARRYFAPDLELRVWQIDPLLVHAPIDLAHTPRGPMPHVHGPIPRRAIVAIHTLDQLHAAPDER